ncbi:hypothetical protein, partial [Mangrovimonas sp. ST2L15]|uniref:hypothetical protein n=1 Tax=Mangrovimonas sp. ST2L15 TaxID=1645916 RepID=UPI000A9DA155
MRKFYVLLFAVLLSTISFAAIPKHTNSHILKNSGNDSICTYDEYLEIVNSSSFSSTNLLPPCQDITVDLDDTGSVTITPNQLEDGTYGGNSAYSISLDQDTFDCNDIGSPVTVTLTVIQISTSSIIDSCTAQVTVQDTTDPTITAPIDVTVSANASCQATGVALGTPTTADNCGVNPATNDAPATFPIGNTTVTWT